MADASPFERRLQLFGVDTVSRHWSVIRKSHPPPGLPTFVQVPEAFVFSGRGRERAPLDPEQLDGMRR